MSNRKIFISFIVLTGILVLGSAILTIINLIDIIRFPPEEMDLTFIVAAAFFVIGIGCLILLIKKLFHWFYKKTVPVVYNAEEWSQAKVASEKKAYKSLQITTIMVFLIVTILQIIVFLM